MLEDEFSSTSHIRKNRLAEMPPQKLVGYTVWIRRIATDGIQTSAIYAGIIKRKYDDLVVVILQISENDLLKNENGSVQQDTTDEIIGSSVQDYGNAHVRVNRYKIVVKIGVNPATQEIHSVWS